MPTPPMTHEMMREAIALVGQYGSVGAAARETKTPYTTLERRYKAGREAAMRGEFGTAPVIPGFHISQVTTGKDGSLRSLQQRPAPLPESEIPSSMLLGEVSVLTSPSGEVLRWSKYKNPGGLNPDQLVSIFKEAFADLDARASLPPAPKKADKDLLTVFPLVDWHVGLMAWAKETGEDWDLKIARETIMGKMRALIDATPASGEAVILGIGDLLHWDGFVQETPSSRHPLDGDGRYPKVLDVAADMVEETIELVAAKHQRVTVRILKGNHDPVSAVAIAAILTRIFRGHKRVTVDNDQAYQWWFRRGRVFLGASHGDKAKMRDLPMLMAHDRPEDWAASTYRKVYTGHVHHESKIEEGGVIVESFRTPVAKDAYHSFNKWRSGRSVYSETFCLDGSEAATLTFNL